MGGKSLYSLNSFTVFELAIIFVHNRFRIDLLYRIVGFWILENMRIGFLRSCLFQTEISNNLKALFC